MNRFSKSAIETLLLATAEIKFQNLSLTLMHTDEYSVGYLPLAEGQSMLFIYDYGANWQFDVKLGEGRRRETPRTKKIARGRVARKGSQGVRVLRNGEPQFPIRVELRFNACCSSFAIYSWCHDSVQFSTASSGTAVKSLSARQLSSLQGLAQWLSRPVHTREPALAGL